MNMKQLAADRAALEKITAELATASIALMSVGLGRTSALAKVVIEAHRGMWWEKGHCVWLGMKDVNHSSATLSAALEEYKVIRAIPDFILKPEYKLVFKDSIMAAYNSYVQENDNGDLCFLV